MSNDSIKMKKYYDREWFTTEEKWDIIRKSDSKCCHCGKNIYVGYGMTVDHFIPLNKGGSNRFINLIPLCKECNDNKDDKLYDIEYLKYVKPKFKKEIEEYLNSYVQVTDYVQRHRLLAYDEYNEYVIVPPRDYDQNRRRKRKNQPIGINTPYKLKLATWDDLDKIHTYLVKYLKKHDSLDDEDTARENIIFWLQFGCIYYIERDNEIKVMIAITIKQMGENGDFRGIFYQPNLFVFPYYMTDITYNIVADVVYQIGDHIIKENDIEFIPMTVSMLKKDNMLTPLAIVYCNGIIRDNVISTFSDFSFLVGNNIDTTNDYLEPEEMNEIEKKTYDFLNSFEDVTDNMIDYFKKYSDRSSVGWMISCILSSDKIKNTELEQFILENNGDHQDNIE